MVPATLTNTFIWHFRTLHILSHHYRSPQCRPRTLVFPDDSKNDVCSLSCCCSQWQLLTWVRGGWGPRGLLTSRALPCPPPPIGRTPVLATAWPPMHKAIAKSIFSGFSLFFFFSFSFFLKCGHWSMGLAWSTESIIPSPCSLTLTHDLRTKVCLPLSSWDPSAPHTDNISCGSSCPLEMLLLIWIIVSVPAIYKRTSCSQFRRR